MSGGHTRAEFLGTGAATLGGAALASAWRSAEAADAQTTDTAAATAATETITEGAFDARFAGEHFYFELEDGPVGFIQPPQGGIRSADVIVEKLGSDHIQKKHIGGVKYEDISIQCATAHAKGMYNWIKASFDRAPVAKSGTIKACDADLRVKWIGEFSNALLTEVGFPACDGGAKDPAYMALKFAPEITRIKKGSGKVSNVGLKAPNLTFKVDIEGLSSARVSKIDSFTVKQTVAGVGQPPVLEIPNLSFWLSPGAGLQSWLNYYEDFVINGNSGDDQEKAGSIKFYRGTKQIESIELQHVGFFKLTPEKVEAGSQKIRRIKAEMYCEDMAINFKG